MPTYRVTGPNGEKYRAEAPSEDALREAILKKWGNPNDAPPPPADDRSWLQKAGDFITGRGQFDEDLPDVPAMVGRGKDGLPQPGDYRDLDLEAATMPGGYRANIDQLRASVPEQVPARFLAALGRGNPLKAAAIWTQQFPNAPAEFDSHGNPIVSVGGKRYFLNRPGASGTDATRAGLELFPAMLLGGGGAAAGRAALGAGGAAGVIGQIAGGAAGSGAASYGLEAAGASQGRQGAEAMGQPGAADVDWKNVRNDAVLGGAGEVFGMVLPRFVKEIRGNPKLYDRSTGTFTARGAAMLREAGLDPEAVGRDFAQAFSENINRGADPRQAAIMADAQSLPVPVRLSRGDVTRNVSHQGFEDRALKTGQPEMVGFRQAQQGDLKANLPEIQGRLSGGAMDPITELGQGADMAATRIKSEAAGLRAQIKAGYDAAGKLRAELPIDQVGQLGKRIKDSIATFPVEAMPTVQTMLKRFEQLVGPRPGVRVNTVTLNGFEMWRQTLNNALDGAQKGGTEAAALARMKRALDGFIDEAIDGAMFTGDPAALQALKDARALRVDFARRFEANDIVARLLKAPAETPPEQLAGYIFNISELGGKKGAAEAIELLREMWGPGSREFAALKEEAFLRLVSGGRGPRGADLEPLFSGTGFGRALDTALFKHPTMMKALFTPEEIGLLQQFKRTALAATNRVPGAVNTSNTATALAQMAERVFGGNSAIVRTLGRMATRPVRAVSDAVKLDRALNPTITPPDPRGVGLGAGVGPQVDEMRRQRP